MTNPLALSQPGWLAGLKLLGLAGFSLWFYLRLNKQDIFAFLAGTLGLNGLLALIFLSGQKVGSLGILLNAFAFFAVFTVLTALVASLVYYYLPQFGVEEEKLVDPDKGVQLPFLMITAFVVLILLRITVGQPFLLLEHPKMGLKLRGASWIIYILASVAAGYLSQFIMPMDVSHDTFVTVQAKVKGINVFEVKEEVSVFEKAGVPAALFVLFFLIPFLMKSGKTDPDYVGFFIFTIIFASFIYLQFFVKKSS